MFSYKNETEFNCKRGRIMLFTVDGGREIEKKNYNQTNNVVVGKWFY